MGLELAVHLDGLLVVGPAGLRTWARARVHWELLVAQGQGQQQEGPEPRHLRLRPRLQSPGHAERLG